MKLEHRKTKQKTNNENTRDSARDYFLSLGELATQDSY